MADKEEGFVESIEGQVIPEKAALLAQEIGEEGTLASIRARVTKIRRNPATDTDEEVPAVVPEVKAKEEAKAAPVQEDDKGKEKEKPAGPKFKTRAAAEAAHAEAERKMHEATTDAAQKTEALAAKDAALALSKKEAAELKTKLEEALKKPPEEAKPAEEEVKPPTKEERKAQLLEVSKTANAKAIEKIDTLDRSLPNYKALVGEVWAEAYTETLLEANLGSPLTQAEIDKMVAKSMKAQKEVQDAVKAEEDKKTAAVKAEEANAALWTQAFELAGKSGLNVAEGSAERDLFEIIAKRDLPKQEFMKGETAPPLKDQVAWVVKEVNTRLGKKIAQTDEERRQAREHQERNQPLTRGGVTKPPGEENLSEPVSLGTIRQQIVASQRARHRGA